MTGEGSDTPDRAEVPADEFDDDVGANGNESRDDINVDGHEDIDVDIDADVSSSSQSDQSAFVKLVNDPDIVLYRRSISSHAPLRWITHNIHTVLGYRREDLLRSEFGSAIDTWSALVHRDSVDRYRRFLRKLLRVDKARCLYQILAADGGYRFIREEARVVRNAEQEIVDVVGCLIDWTDLTTIQYNDSIGDFDGGSVARRYRMRELELVADLLASHSYIRQQARGYRDVVQTLRQITDRLQASAGQGGLSGLIAGVSGDTAQHYDGDQLPIGIYRAHPTASRSLARSNDEMARLINLDQHDVDAKNPSGFELSSVTTPDIARTNEETVDLAIRSREDFDLVYPVVGGHAHASDAGWTRWIWEQGRVEYDSEHQPVAIHGVVADVTDSMATESDNIDSSRQSKIPFDGIPDGLHAVGQESLRNKLPSSVGSSDLADGENSLNEFMAGPVREPMAAEDEVVAVFSSSNMLETDHPTVDLMVTENNVDGESSRINDGEVGEGKPITPPIFELEPENQPLSDVGAEIASWDRAGDLADEKSRGDLHEESSDFDYFGDDMPYYLDSLSDDPARPSGAAGFDLGSERDSTPDPAGPFDASAAVPIADDFDQFRVYGQPAFAVNATTELVYVEILLRMLNANGKLLTPAEFDLRKVSARTQIEVDLWVVRQAISSLERMISKGSDAGVSINISSHTLADETFVEKLNALIRTSQVPAAKIAFEIGDSRMPPGSDLLSAHINRLKTSGCRLTLDNFSGDGITLTQLRRLAVNQVNIDGDLVRNFTSNEVDRSIISSICQVAREMGISVTAQHVEHTDAIDQLAALGIDFVQGNGLAVAGPFEAFSDRATQPDQPVVAH